MARRQRLSSGRFDDFDFDGMLARANGDFEQFARLFDEYLDELNLDDTVSTIDYVLLVAEFTEFLQAHAGERETQRLIRKYGLNADGVSPEDKFVYTHAVGRGFEPDRYNRQFESRQRRRRRSMTEANKGYSSAVYQALDSDFRDGWSGKVDPVYVSDQVELWLMNDKPCYDNIFNTRMKAHSVAYAAMLSLFQDVVDRYDVKVRVTSEMAKQWLKRNGMNYIEVLKPVVSRVEEEREERKADRNESYRRRSAKRNARLSESGSRPFNGWSSDAADYYYALWDNGKISISEIEQELENKYHFDDDFIECVIEAIYEREEDERRYECEHDYDWDD